MHITDIFDKDVAQVESKYPRFARNKSKVFQHANCINDFFEDHVRAMRWFTAPENHDEAIRIIAAFIKQPSDSVKYLFTKDDYFRDPFLFPNVKGIQSMADSSHEVGLAPVKIEIAPKYVDTSFVEEAKRRIEAGGTGTK